MSEADRENRCCSAENFRKNRKRPAIDNMKGENKTKNRASGATCRVPPRKRVCCGRCETSAGWREENSRGYRKRKKGEGSANGKKKKKTKKHVKKGMGGERSE